MESVHTSVQCLSVIVNLLRVVKLTHKRAALAQPVHILSLLPQANTHSFLFTNYYLSVIRAYIGEDCKCVYLVHL